MHFPLLRGRKTVANHGGKVEMDQGEKSYRRFFSGDWEGLREIIDEYYDGLVACLGGGDIHN